MRPPAITAPDHDAAWMGRCAPDALDGLRALAVDAAPAAAQIRPPALSPVETATLADAWARHEAHASQCDGSCFDALSAPPASHLGAPVAPSVLTALRAENALYTDALTTLGNVIAGLTTEREVERDMLCAHVDAEIERRVAAEREACAKACDAMAASCREREAAAEQDGRDADEESWSDMADVAQDCADAVRARGVR